MVNERDFSADVCIVDKAWQVTCADPGGLGPLSSQVIWVGDPGQIAPCSPATRPADGSGPLAPQQAAIEAAYPDAVTRLRLTHPYRLGPRTAALIAPAFYPDLPFDSARAPWSLDLDGQSVPNFEPAARADAGGARRFSADHRGGDAGPALSRHRTHVTVIADVDTSGVLRHAGAENPQDAVLAIHEQILGALGS